MTSYRWSASPQEVRDRWKDIDMSTQCFVFKKYDVGLLLIMVRVK